MSLSSTPHADELNHLVNTVRSLVVPFVAAADADAIAKPQGRGIVQEGIQRQRTTLVEPLSPEQLAPRLLEGFPQQGRGVDGLREIGEKVLKSSVNTWDQGFLDKLYGSTNAIGVAADLLLATLNTNVHVYQVSPALTLIEKHTHRFLASLFGLTGPNAGGISVPGGSFANHTALVVARNTLHPETVTHGLASLSRPPVLFTSDHSHYSVAKAAQQAGLGLSAVRRIPVDPATGALSARALAEAVTRARAQGDAPFFVNATAGTTVLGAWDPLEAIADICEREGMWMHVDASWGGGAVFGSEETRRGVRGVERADSVGMCLHKMMGVPVTCSVLLGKDLRAFERAMRVDDAGYLFHGGGDGGEHDVADYVDLGQLTPACGRRGDALKLYLSLQYHGLEYYSRAVETAFANARYLDGRLREHPHVVAASPQPLPCLQVCFYWARDGRLREEKDQVSRETERLVQGLIDWGWMSDFAPGDHGNFLRLVVGIHTRRETLDGFVQALEGVAEERGM